MKLLTVKTAKKYDIIIENGALSSAGKYIAKRVNVCRAVVVSDSNVAPLYAGKLSDSLKAAGFEVSLFTFAPGEPSKRMQTVSNILSFLAQEEITRSDMIVALGGGVVGDIAGFAASIYMRGIQFVQVPTSLLAQIDSSVGGKTAVDLPEGKNLAGTFWQPSFVLIDPLVLSTLGDRFFSDGMAEAIKYGCIRSKALFNRLLEEDSKNFLEEMIFECVGIKKLIVEKDEFEKNERMLLNFGHTLGHAIEKYYNFEYISHGEAVGLGMIKAATLGEQTGFTEKGSSQKIEKILKKYNLPTELNIKVEDLIGGIFTDKKRKGTIMNLVLLNKIGEAFVFPAEIKIIKNFFNIH